MTHSIHRINEASTVIFTNAQTVSLIQLRRVRKDIPTMSIISH